MKNIEPKKPKQEPMQPTSPPDDLSPDDSLISPAMQKILNGMTPLNRRNRIEIIQKVAEGTASFWHIKLLRADGLMTLPKDSVTSQSGNDICESQGALAIRMAQHYSKDGENLLKIKIAPGVISRWHKLKTPESAANPPPGMISGSQNRYSLSDWIKWFDKYLLPTFRKGGVRAEAASTDSDEDDLTILEQREKRDAIKHKRWERDREKGKYTLKETAAWTAASLGVVARNAARDVFENLLAPKAGIGLEAFIPDETQRNLFIEKLRRDGVELFVEFQNQYRLRAAETIKKEAPESDEK